MPLRNPQFRYLTTGLEINRTSMVSIWNLTADVDWRSKLVSPVVNQDANSYCSACWAFAAAGAIEGAVAAAKGSAAAASLSVQQLIDCSTGSCYNGGYSSDAFEYVIGAKATGLKTNTSYPYTGEDGEVCGVPGLTMHPGVQVVTYEKVSIPGALGLMLAVQFQPITIQLEADQDSFVNYDGTYIYRDDDCFANGVVNHEVLLVGYHFTPGAALSDSSHYFILKNSWGTSWGDKGYMYIGMQQGANGYCGMWSNEAYYPVLPVTTSDKDVCATNPCGGGRCRPTTTPSNMPDPTVSSTGQHAYECNCSGKWFLGNGTNINGSPTCVSWVQCTLSSANPCGIGACQDDGDGKHHCICPRYYDSGKRPGGASTCVPGSNLTNTYKIKPGDSCYGIATTKGLTVQQLKAQNPHVDCGNLSKFVFQDVNVTADLPFNCSLYYTATHGANCSTIASTFSITTELVKYLNPGLNCSYLVQGQPICVQNGTLSTASSTTVCTQYATVGSANETCESIRGKYSMTPQTFFAANQGIQCGNLAVGDTVCVKSTTSSGNGATSCQKKYTVKSTDTCASLTSTYFKGLASWIYKLNSGFVCLNSKLYVGLVLCVCWW